MKDTAVSIKDILPNSAELKKLSMTARVKDRGSYDESSYMMQIRDVPKGFAAENSSSNRHEAVRKIKLT